MLDCFVEKIVQTGKKKLALDHLIVQKMDDDEPGGGDVQSILTYGAQALFEEDGQNSRDIHCMPILLFSSYYILILSLDSEMDVKNLIVKTEEAKEQDEQEEGKSGSFSFSFAKVWAADKDTLDEMPDESEQPAEATDSWARTLEKIEVEREMAKAAEISGRGARRKAAHGVSVRHITPYYLITDHICSTVTTRLRFAERGNAKQRMTTIST